MTHTPDPYSKELTSFEKKALKFESLDFGTLDQLEEEVIQPIIKAVGRNAKTVCSFESLKDASLATEALVNNVIALQSRRDVVIRSVIQKSEHLRDDIADRG